MLFPVQARRLFPRCSVEEVPIITVTGCSPSGDPAGGRTRTVDEESPWSSGRDPKRRRTLT
jgi:hypothetical protein